MYPMIIQCEIVVAATVAAEGTDFEPDEAVVAGTAAPDGIGRTLEPACCGCSP